MQWKRLVRALAHTVRDQALDLVGSLLVPVLRTPLHQAFPSSRPSPWLSSSIWAGKTIDGAVIEGVVPSNAYAKYALPKGLPVDGKSKLAIENDPHTLDGFSGVIEEGYGKGIKSLLYRDSVIVKIKGKTFPALAEYHFHEADRAGDHFDLCVEKLPPNTKQFEINIPKGEYQGRYAFNQTDRGMIVTRMIDRGLNHPKPAYSLKPEEILKDLSEAHKQGLVHIDQKMDGSLGNAAIHDYRAHFRSHRDTGSTYYDQLPQLEFLNNQSPIFLARRVFPGPRLSGTVLQGELFHPDGAPRVSGILNALPERARQIQALRGPVSYYAWDIIRLRGRDVSKLPYGERRQLLESTVSEIRRFNKHWDIVPECPQGEDPYAWYQKVVSQPLPWGEGVVVKNSQKAHGEDTWIKVKQRDFVDFEVVAIEEGTGKYAGTVGRLIVRNPENKAIGEIGSFAISDQQRNWIWDHRRELLPDNDRHDPSYLEVGSYPIAKCLVMDVTESGRPRAGVFIAWHEGKGATEAGLVMYAESLSGGSAKETQDIIYRLKSSAGWRK